MGTQDTEESAGGLDRRALLKGAVAAGVGVAAYSAPIVSSVPAYATHGLSTVTVTGNAYCIWFSPNHESLLGDWHTSGDGNGSAVPGFPGHGPATDSTALITFTVPVSGSVGGNRTVEIQGNPNNSSFTVLGDFTSDGWNGGGVRIKLLDPTCEMQILGVSCKSKCKNDGSDPEPPASWGSGSSFSAIDGSAPGGIGSTKFQGDASRSVYYHSGRPDHDGVKKRCKLGIWFRINCEN